MRLRTLLLLVLAMLFGNPPAAARADAMDAMKQYSAAMSAVHSYHMEVSGDKQTVSMDLALPDRMHIYGGGGGPEVIMVKPDVWIKLGNRWQKFPSNGGAPNPWSSHADSSRPPTDVDKGYNITDLGIQESYHAYLLTPKKGGEVLTLFLRPDFLPAKTVATGKNGTTTTVYSNFNNVTVEAPK